MPFQLSIEQLDKATDEIEDAIINLLNTRRDEELSHTKINNQHRNLNKETMFGK